MGYELKPIYTNNLFRPLADKLISLLKGLHSEAWAAATCYPTWTVHDIVVHLFQTGAMRLSAQRDKYVKRSHSLRALDYETLSQRINKTNDNWTRTLVRLSPDLLIRFLEITELELADFFATLAHEGVAPVGVSWAGQAESALWFDTAREFTERWHHQQQIREAVGAESIAEPQFLSPVTATLIRATPYWYRTLSTREGTKVAIQIEGNSGGEWVLTYSEMKWCLKVGSTPSPDAAVRMSEDTAWRFLTRTISSTQAENKMSFSGGEELAHCFLNVAAIMMPKELR